MQKSPPKTPCRRVGLRRLPIASQTKPTAALKAVAGTSQRRKEKKFSLPPTMHLGNICEVASEASAPLLGEESTTTKCFIEQPSSLTETCQGTSCEDHNASSRDGIFKKPKLSLWGTPPTPDDLHSLQRRIALKEKQLQDLHRAETICRKHNAEKLKTEIKQWLGACQEALQELLSHANSNENNISMSKLLHELGIPPELVQYDTDSEDFK